MIWNYAIQTEDSKKIIKYSKVRKVLEKMQKRTERKHRIDIVSIYREIKQEYTVYGPGEADIYDSIDRIVSGNRQDYKQAIESLIYDMKLRIKYVQKTKNQAKNKEKVSSNESYNGKTVSQIDYEIIQPIISDSIETGYDHSRLSEKEMLEMEIRNSNDTQKVEQQLAIEAEIYDQSLKSGQYDKAFSDKKYSFEEKERQEYLRDMLKTEYKLNKPYKKEILWKIKSLMESAKQIQELMEINLQKTSIPLSGETKLSTATYVKYDPYKLLLMYEKQYEITKKQFDKLSGDEKQCIQRYLQEKGIEFIPSKQDILDKVNENIQKIILERGYGQRDGQKNIVIGLTRYMSQDQISRIYSIMKAEVERRFRSVNLSDIYTQEQLEIEIYKRNRSNENPYNIKDEKKKMEYEQIMVNQENSAKCKKTLKNMQESFCASISCVRAGRKETRMSYTEICEQILQEQPLFEEAQISPDQIALLDKQTSLTTTEVKNNFLIRLMSRIREKFTNEKEK